MEIAAIVAAAKIQPTKTSIQKKKKKAGFRNRQTRLPEKQVVPKALRVQVAH